MDTNIVNAYVGALSGAFSSVIGYLKALNKAKEEKREEPFDWAKFLESVFEAMLAGGLVGYIAQSPYAAFAAGLSANLIADAKKLKITSRE